MLHISPTKLYSVIALEHGASDGNDDLAASKVQGLFKIFKARRDFAQKALQRQAENRENNIVAPFVPTPAAAVRAFCDTYLQNEEVVLDLGCGDGRVLLAALETGKLGLGIGVDIQPQPLQRAIDASMGSPRLFWILGDFKDDRVRELLPRVTLCFLFLLPTLLDDIARYLVQHVRVGTRIVCYTFCLQFPFWEPLPHRTIQVEALKSSGACTLWEFVVTPEVKLALCAPHAT